MNEATAGATGGRVPAWLAEVVSRRRMTRAFRPDAVGPEVVDSLVDLARRAPSAGNTAGFRVVVLDRPEDVEGYWSVALPAERRPTFPWPELPAAPVLLLPCVSAAAYVERYGEDDKGRRPAASDTFRQALGREAAGWTVPYWFVDGGMAVMAILVGAEAAGLGALFFGLFEQEAAVRALLGIPAGWQPLGVVALGWPAPGPQRPSRSAATRRRQPLEEMRYRGAWPSSQAR